MLHNLVIGPASWARQALHCGLVLKLCSTINLSGSSIKTALNPEDVVQQQHMLSGKLDNIVKLC